MNTDPPPRLPSPHEVNAPVREAEATARERRRAIILEALQRAHGNRTQAAALAGYSSPRALRTAARDCGIDLVREAPPPPDPHVTGNSQKKPREQFAARRPKAKKAAKRAARGKR